MARLQDLFNDHPAAAGETYGEHMGFAFGFGWRLMKAALAAYVHGLLPWLFETTASSAVLGMNDEIRARRAALAAGQRAAQRA